MLQAKPVLRLFLLSGLMACLAAGSAAASVLSAVAFEENRGQLPAAARFATRANAFGVLAYAGGPAIRARRDGRLLEFRLRFVNGKNDIEPTAELLLPGRLHYFRGSDPEDWQTDVRRYARVRYSDVYPGIDAVLHERNGQVELDFEVAPEADPEQIALVFDGADRVAIEPDGRLMILLGEEGFELSAPEIYQRGPEGRELRTGRYRFHPTPDRRHAQGLAAEPTRVDFQIAVYDRERELVIDPVFLGFSTRLGGSGGDSLRAIETDGAGNLFLTGSTTSTDFAGLSPSPVGEDVFVAKLDPTTQIVDYVAFFGGDGFDQAWGIDVDSLGNAYLAGWTTSSTFPTLNGFDATVDNTDAFLLKLDPSGILVYGTVYGGADLDGEFNGGVGVHEMSGRVYLGSRTDTTTLPTSNAFSTNCPAGPCPFIAGFDPSQVGAASLVYASYLDGAGGILDLDVDNDENLYAFGFTNPTSQIVMAGQGFQDSSGDLNNNDHFLVKLDPSLAGALQRVYSTFIGGFGDEDERGGIDALDSGVVYVGSRTGSTAATFPILNALQASNAGGTDGYVFKIDTTTLGAASRLWGTFLGSAFDDEISAVAADAAGNVWVAALVSSNASSLFPKVLPLPGSGVFGIDDDAAVAEISSDGTTLLFGSPVVAGGLSETQDLVVLPSGRVVVGGSRIDANFPLMAGLELFATGGSEIALVGLDAGPDLGLVLEIDDSMDPAATGEDFAFQYLVRNKGVDDAAAGILTSDFPSGLVASLASANCSLPGSSSTCNFFEDIPRGGDSPIYIVASAASPGSFTVNGSVTSDLVDPSPGDDSDSETVSATAGGSFPASLVLSDFDFVANSQDIGGFALDTSRGVLATPNGVGQEVVNLMKTNASLPFQIEDLLGQGEVAFGLVDSANWTPVDGDASDLFGRDFNALADRVFAIVDSTGAVELRTAAAFDQGRVIDRGFVPLGRSGLLSIAVGPSNAQVFFDGFVVAEGDPFTGDFRDALAANIGDDFVVSVGFGTEDRGAAILSVPEPSALRLLIPGVGLLWVLCPRRRSRHHGRKRKLAATC